MTLRTLRRPFLLLLGILGTAAVSIIIIMNTTPFGSTPAGTRKERIERSPHYRDGQFRNLSHTPEITEGYTMLGVAYEFFFTSFPRLRPAGPLPSMKSDLLSLPPDQDVLVWFGHSSYFIQIDGKRILVDPIFSGNASPIPGTTRSYPGTDRYTADDLPPIDYLFISHDHYDHVDVSTLKALQQKVRLVICGLGVGAHLERWGYESGQIVERDWFDTVVPDSGFTIHTTPARHFSGRSLFRNNTLWMSYVVKTPTMSFYIGGDSGYDTFFREIGEQHGPFDLVMLDAGQYDKKWKYIHMLPEEVVPAAVDLKAKRLFPVHNSKFTLGNHPWDEPLTKVEEQSRLLSMPLVTPMIGEVVRLKDAGQTFRPWWKGLE
ncbi:MAG: MBL fold metallo-hydrolase [Bacteroidetes bacterium]|nr:MBL fold metallo-hydrolase [Bacteroidota bacterium]